MANFLQAIAGNFATILNTTEPPAQFTEDGITFVATTSSGSPFLSYGPQQIFVSAGNISPATVTVRFQTTDGNTATFLNASFFSDEILGTQTVAFLTPNGSQLGIARAPSDNFNLTGFSLTGVRFIVSTGQTISIESITADAVCFRPGTHISTMDGETVVEDLVPGDRVLTASGAETTVRWVGQQTVGIAFGASDKVNPICITAGTFGNARDLFVSPDHGVFVDGYLVNASALVNGDTIYQVAQMPETLKYHHVETDAQELILAEGCPVESFINYAGLGRFDNSEAHTGGPRSELEVPRITAARGLPARVRQRVQQTKAA